MTLERATVAEWQLVQDQRDGRGVGEPMTLADLERRDEVETATERLSEIGALECGLECGGHCPDCRDRWNEIRVLTYTIDTESE